VFWVKNGLEMRFWVKKQRTSFFRPPQWSDSRLEQATRRLLTQATRHFVFELFGPPH